MFHSCTLWLAHTVCVYIYIYMCVCVWVCVCVYLSEVKLEDVADVMRWTLGQLHQLFAVLKGLTQLLHTSLHPVHSVDALRGGKQIPLNHFKILGYPAFTKRAPSHLHLERPSLYLRNALGDDEGDAVTGTAGHLRELPAKQLQTTLQLLMATLDCQSLQTALVTGQETLRTERAPLTSCNLASQDMRVSLQDCMVEDMMKDSPPHTPPPGSKHSCHTRGTLQESVVSSVGGSGPL